MKKRSGSSPRAQPRTRSAGATKTSELIAKRLRKHRPVSAVNLRIPADLIEELRRVAGALGFSNYESLIRAYIGKGLRIDIARLDEGSVPGLIASPKHKGGRRQFESTGVSRNRPSDLGQISCA